MMAITTSNSISVNPRRRIFLIAVTLSKEDEKNGRKAKERERTLSDRGAFSQPGLLSFLPFFLLVITQINVGPSPWDKGSIVDTVCSPAGQQAGHACPINGIDIAAFLHPRKDDVVPRSSLWLRSHLSHPRG
jgi:hypothetical protein